LEPQLNDFAASVFETVCREFIRKKNRQGELHFRVSKLGRWWGKLNQTVLTELGKEKISSVVTEIDIVAVDAKSKNYILGECKFRNSEMDAQNLKQLKGKSGVAKKGATIQYALFSKSGFTKGLSEEANADESIRLFSLSDVVNG
jgi:hypothetical protein